MPFKLLEGADLKLLFLKVILFLALTSAKCIGELHALSVHESCLQFPPDYGKLMLQPNPAFVSKIKESAYSCPTLELIAFHPPPFAQEEERQLNALGPVRASHIYLDRTRDFSRRTRLFVSWAPFHKGEASLWSLRARFSENQGHTW